MSTGKWFGMLAAILSLLATGVHADDELLRLESCVDARGRSVPTAANYSQPLLVRTVVEDGRATIRYNPEALPRLSAAARLFFYAAQCARAGETGGSDAASADSARRADCGGVAALLAGGLLRRDELPGLQAELNALGDADWRRLPGPPRGFALSTCPPAGRGVLHLPLADTPSAREVARNDCVRGCADRLWRCQKSCRGDACTACLTTYELCDAACGDGATAQ